MLHFGVLVNFGTLIGSYKLTKDILSLTVLFCIPGFGLLYFKRSCPI